MGWLRDPMAGLLDRIDRRRWPAAAALVAAGLAAAWALALSSGSLTAVSRHWFYLPVVFAAVRFGLPGALIGGTTAAVLAGPAVFTVDGAASWETWAARGAFFVAVGVLVAELVAVVRAGQSRAIELAEQEKTLAYQRAALIQTVSHEFRTPLTLLHGGIQTLDARRDEVSERLRPLIDSLARAEHRLEEMVSVVLGAADALDAADRLTAEPVDVDLLLTTVVRSLHRADAATRVVTRIGPDARVVVTVPGYLQLALRCVTDNALRFSPADRPVIISVARHADEVVLAVRDHGCGIDPDFLDEAFQPFTQFDASARRTHGGLGIGLFTARTVIERLNGTIGIHVDDDAASSGTTIQIVLPQRRDADRRGRLRSGPPDIRIDRTETVETPLDVSR